MINTVSITDLQYRLHMYIMHEEYNVTVKIVVFILKESESTLLLDLISAETSKVHYGVKLVRGAYMEQEREEAAKNNYEDPIWESKENTDHNYHKLLDMLLRKMQVESSNICVMVATHNEDSVLCATDR